MSELKARIQDGLSGKFKGLNNGFDRLNSITFGIQRGCYYLLGGLSGTYKTTLADFMLLNALKDADEQGIEFNVFYYSYEIDALSKQCNWLSAIIFQKYNVTIAPEKIKGLGDNRLTLEEQELIDKEIPYIESLFERIHFRYKAINPTGLYNELWKFAESKGRFELEDYIDKEGKTKQKIKKYIPNNPNAYFLSILDHQLLLQKERGFTNKECIDKYSEYCVELRNMFGWSFINISQFNDGLSSVDRAKFKGVDLSPQITDFKESRSPYADADVVYGTMCPYKLDMERCLDYDITKLKSNMIMLKVIKNRLSTDNVAIGLLVNPKSMSFYELPKASDTDRMNKVYKYLEEIK